MKRASGLAVVCAIGVGAPCGAQVSLVASCPIPADARDLSGLTGTVGGVPHDRLGGMGSAVAWTGRGWEFVMLADRGPADGAADYHTRFHVVRLEPDPGTGALAWSVERTVLLTDEEGHALPGFSGAIDNDAGRRSPRFDPEGVRLGADGTVYISDEYGPWVDAFSADGKRVRRLDVPEAFCPQSEDRLPEGELPPRNSRGRQPNRGFEGLALTPDGTELWAIPQSPLIQDGALDGAGKRAGVNVRVLVLGTDGVPKRQHVYRLAHPRNGVSEMLAIDGTRMLVLERDGHAGAEARRRAVYVADFSGATDVSGIAALPQGDLGPDVRAARTREFIDFLDPKFGLAGASMPEKIEGLAFGPDLPDGRRTLVVTTDNDFKDGAPSWVWVFAFPASELGAR